jgi:chaperonin GroEL
MYDESKTSESTKVIFSTEARKQLFKGLETVADAVSCTLGPKGKTVLIQQDGSSPIVTKDGVTVSKSIKLKEPVERMGAQLIREAASQTNYSAGDGTTTSTVLTHALVKSGLKYLESGYTAKELSDGIEKTVSKALEILRSSAKQLTSSEEIAQIATISANGDTKIGELIAEAMNKVGHDGIITVEDAKGMLTALELVDGMQIDRGYLSPYFVTNSDKMTASYNDAKVLLVDHKISGMKDMIPILEKVMQSRTPLLIIADDVEGEALQGLVINRVNANLPVVAIKSPGYGQHKEELLRDIAVLTGGKVVSAVTGMKLANVTLSDLGTLKKFVVDAKSTTLVGSPQYASEVEKHVQDLKIQLQDITLNVDEVTKLRTRIAKLASGVAVIKVGGSTEVEMTERKYRIEDALHATRAAVDEGIVPGGGMALFNVWQQLSTSSTEDNLGAGTKIVMDACLAPVKKIVLNAGYSPDIVINELNKVKREGQDFIGYNAAQNTYDDMMKVGVIDPVKVTRTALLNASSVAITFLTLDAVVVEDK